MLMTVAELRSQIQTTLSDEALKDKLSALESLIRKVTNNNFQNRNIRFETDITDKIPFTSPLLKVGDTIQITNSLYNEGVYDITAIADGIMTLNESLYPEEKVTITKVIYPADIKAGAINMFKWDVDNRDKAGIASETISRHSVTYSNMDGDNSSFGFPKSLIGFLKPYMKARF